MKDILKRIFADFPERKTGFMRRDLSLPAVKNRIHTIIGPRRSGKTFFLYQIIDDLMKSGIGKRQILFLNFEDERLKGLNQENYDIIFEAFLELYPETAVSDIHVFFDEIQVLPDWEKFVRRLFDGVTAHLYLSGSNSAMLSKEIATSLRGRNIVTCVLPLSFREFLGFQNIDIKRRFGLNETSKINRAFGEYLKWGGYPEIIHYPPEVKIDVLQNYFDIIIYRDLIERYTIPRADLMKYLMKKIVSCVTKEVSINKIYNELKSSRYQVSRDTIYEYSGYIKNIFFCEFVEKFHPSTIKRESWNKKAYFFDNGLLSALNYGFSEDLGKLLENLVFVELKRRGYEVFYARNSHECDFVAVEKTGKKMAIQVAYELNSENLKREIAGLELVTGAEKFLVFKENQTGVKDKRLVPIIQWLTS